MGAMVPHADIGTLGNQASVFMRVRIESRCRVIPSLLFKCRHEGRAQGLGECVGATGLSTLRSDDVARPGPVEGDGKPGIVNEIGRVLGKRLTPNAPALLAPVEDEMPLSPCRDEGETDIHAHGIIAP